MAPSWTPTPSVALETHEEKGTPRQWSWRALLPGNANRPDLRDPAPKVGNPHVFLTGYPAVLMQSALCVSHLPLLLVFLSPFHPCVWGTLGQFVIFNELTTCIFCLSFDKTRRAHLNLIGRAEDAQDWMESWGVSLGGGLLCPVNGGARVKGWPEERLWQRLDWCSPPTSSLDTKEDGVSRPPFQRG